MEFDIATQSTEILKEQEVLGGKFDKANYLEKRLWATADDGQKVPISLVYHKDTKLNASTPILQYAYGSYGSTIDPGFSTTRLSLLDRGFAYAIAHIRGESTLGDNGTTTGKCYKRKHLFRFYRLF